jgi:hypothetical protein
MKVWRGRGLFWALVASFALLISLFPSLEVTGQRDAASAAADTASAVRCAAGSSALQPKTTDPYGTPSGSTLSCTGAPLKPCTQNQYSG